jgi:hypothetical protein
MKKLNLALSILLIVFLASTVKAQTQTIQGNSNLTSSTIRVYSDQNCTLNLTTIDWGTLSPGENKTVPTYIQSTQDCNLTITGVSNSTDVSFYTTHVNPLTGNLTQNVNFTVSINPNATAQYFTVSITLDAGTPTIPELSLPAAIICTFLFGSIIFELAIWRYRTRLPKRVP